MKLSHLEVHHVPVNHRGGWLFVELHTDEGLVGLGEASQSDDDRLCSSLLKAMGERLRGKELLDIQPRWRELLPLAEERCGQTALSAIEQALWDLLGQAAGQPIHRLLGGAVKPAIPLYANINRGNAERSAESFARRAEAAVAGGFASIKLAPFDEVSARDASAVQWRDAQPGIARVAAVRKAIGPQISLMVDCHWRFDEISAIRLAKALAELDVCWFEDPVEAMAFGSYRVVAAAVPMLVAGGETLFGLRSFLSLMESGGAAYVMPDVKHCGGLAVAQAIGKSGEAREVSTSLHNPSGPVSTAASIHVSATISASTFLEYQWDEVPWRPDLITPAEQCSNGIAMVSDAPGLGVRLNHEVLRRVGGASL